MTISPAFHIEVMPLSGFMMVGQSPLAFFKSRSRLYGYGLTRDGMGVIHSI